MDIIWRKKAFDLLKTKKTPVGVFCGEGGIRTHGGPEGHNGFRDRPDQPLRHLSNSSMNYIRAIQILS